MRRSTRLGLAVAIVLLLVLGGIYTAFWFVVAGRIEDGIGQAAQALRAQNVDLSWQSVRVGGYPWSFRIDLGAARLREAANPQAGEVRLSQLSGSAHPWNFRVWRLSAPEGLSAVAGPANAAIASLTAQSAAGSVAVAGDNSAAIWLDLDRPLAESDIRVAARDAQIWLNLPPHPPQSHTEPAFAIALDAHELTLPAVPAPLHNPLDELSFGATLMGPVQPGPPSRAASAWRDGGGTVELEHFGLRWGDLAIDGSGTLALDPDLQPIGGFSGGIEGYDELMNALVSAGRMRASDARLARLGLAMLAKAGPDGRPEISTSFTIQNGEMYLGPAKLGKAPRIAWQQ